MNYQTHLGDSLEILKSIPSNSVDSLVTDPPAGIGLHNLEWDNNKGGRDNWIYWLTQIMAECYRVLKPGAHGVVWALPRTAHWTTHALEDSGFNIKDVIVHIFGNGFPKNISIEKALVNSKYDNTDDIYKVTAWIKSRRDQLKLTNKDLDRITECTGGASHWTAGPNCSQAHIPTFDRWQKLEKLLGPPPEDIYRLICNEKKDSEKISSEWHGWGTSLKPANEHWILIQKPISEHNIAANIKKFKTGGINIDECRIPVLGDKIPSNTYLKFGRNESSIWNLKKRNEVEKYNQHPKGRFPCNVILTKSTNGILENTINKQGDRKNIDVTDYFFKVSSDLTFIYCKRADKHDRGYQNTHPTVKSISLMKYLTKLVTPVDGVILDPFMGSGSTGVAAIKQNFRFVGIEQDQDYYQIAIERLKGANNE